MKFYNYSLFVLIGVLSLTFNRLHGQEVLAEYVHEALEQNLARKNVQLNIRLQENKVEEANRLKGLNVDLNSSYLFASGGRKIIFPVGDLFNPTYSTLNQLTESDMFPTDLANEEIQLTPNNFLDAQLSASYPLINSGIKYNRLIQSEILQINEQELEANAVSLVHQVKQAYFNYLKTMEGIEILDTSLVLLQKVKRFNEKLVKFDKATDEIIADVQFQIEDIKSQKASVIENKEIAKTYFNLLLHRDLDADILVDEGWIESISLENRSLKSLIQIAIERNAQLKQLHVQDKIYQLDAERIQKSGNPSVALFGGVGIQTESFNLDAGGPLLTAGIQMNWKLFDNGLRKQKAKGILVEKDINKHQESLLRENIKLQVIQAVQGLKSLEQKMRSETAAEESARQSLSKVQTRYENDNAILLEVLQAQNRWTTAKLAKSLTKYDYIIKQSELSFILQENNSHE